MNSIYWLRIYHVLQHIVCIRTVYEDDGYAKI